MWFIVTVDCDRLALCIQLVRLIVGNRAIVQTSFVFTHKRLLHLVRCHEIELRVHIQSNEKLFHVFHLE